MQSISEVQKFPVSGNNDLSVIVIGGVYTFKSGWQLSLGTQMPTPRSNNEFGLVMEFTYPGFKFKDFKR